MNEVILEVDIAKRKFDVALLREKSILFPDTVKT
jgi:hypothetical protein